MFSHLKDVGLIVLKWDLRTFAAIFFGLVLLSDDDDGLAATVAIGVRLGGKVANRHRVCDQLLLRMLKEMELSFSNKQNLTFHVK